MADDDSIENLFACQAENDDTPQIISRDDAIVLGFVTYFTGKSCKNGHFADRYVRDGKCVICTLNKNKKQRAKNRLKNNSRMVENYYKNQEKRKVYARRYYRKNKRLVNKKANIAHKARRYKDINFYLNHALRCRLNKIVKRNQKAGSAIRDLGCSLELLKQHLETQFLEGMTWHNRGRVWHIDHIEPLCSFDLTDHEQFLIACHYTNLRPLFKQDNLKKIAEDIKKSIHKPDSNYSCLTDLLKDN